MKNIVILQKQDDGTILCQQITKRGLKYAVSSTKDEGYWEEGGTILLDELEKILDREI